MPINAPLRDGSTFPRVGTLAAYPERVARRTAITTSPLPPWITRTCPKKEDKTTRNQAQSSLVYGGRLVRQLDDQERDTVPPPQTVHLVLLDPSVEMAMTMIAQMIGLPNGTVTQILQDGLPLIAHLTTTYPLVLQRLHAMSLVPLPEPLADFYVRMAESAAVRQAVLDDYRATFGAMLDDTNREAACLVGTTDRQAREVIAVALPAVSHVLRQLTKGGDGATFARTLRSMAA
jgi:hypothetical protein